MSALTDSAAWRTLQARAQSLEATSLGALFAADPDRAGRFAAEWQGLYLDYSKQRLDAPALSALFALATQQDLSGWIARLFAGEAINHTEQRAAAHMALRAPREARFAIAGRDVLPEVWAVRDRMRAFAESVRDGSWKGAGGAAITDVVNIGIGGSDLGPRMVAEALAPFADGPRAHYVANVDGAQLQAVLARVQPATTRDHQQDLHHPGDHGQRRRRARLAGGGAGRGCHPEALRRRLHQRRRGRPLRHCRRQRVRLLGLGWRPLFAVERGRALAGRDPRPRALRRPARRRPRDGRALP